MAQYHHKDMIDPQVEELQVHREKIGCSLEFHFLLDPAFLMQDMLQGFPSEQWQEVAAMAMYSVAEQ